MTAWPSSRCAASRSISARTTCCAGSTSKSTSTRWCASSARRARESRRCCAASTVWRPIQDGTIVVDGRAVSRLESSLNCLRRDVGIVFQSFNLFPHMSVLKNVTLAPREGALPLARTKREARARVLLERIGLWEKAPRVPRPPLGRPAATRRDRARAGDAAVVDAARRDHERARPRARGRSARDGAGARRTKA